MNYNPELRFSRQVNYPDLAWNIHALVYAYKLNDNYEAIEGLLALDVAYRNESKAQYCKSFRELVYDYNGDFYNLTELHDFLENKKTYTTSQVSQ